MVNVINLFVIVYTYALACAIDKYAFIVHFNFVSPLSLSVFWWKSINLLKVFKFFIQG